MQRKGRGETGVRLRGQSCPSWLWPGVRHLHPLSTGSPSLKVGVGVTLSPHGRAAEITGHSVRDSTLSTAEGSAQLGYSLASGLRPFSGHTHQWNGHNARTQRPGSRSHRSRDLESRHLPEPPSPFRDTGTVRRSCTPRHLPDSDLPGAKESSGRKRFAKCNPYTGEMTAVPRS